MDETMTHAPAFGAKELERLSRLLERYRAGKTRTDKRMISSENWWKLRNSGEENSPLTGGEGFHAVSGWLHNVITSKHADAMDAYPEPVILPREEGDIAEARRLQAVIPCILERNGFERTYSDVAWQKLKSGTGAYKVIWDKGALGGLGDIAVERVNLLNLFWEPGITDIQKSEAVFHTELVSRDAIVAERPDLASKLKAPALVGAHFAYDDTVDTSDKVTVVECYYKKKSSCRGAQWAPADNGSSAENERAANGRPYNVVDERAANGRPYNEKMSPCRGAQWAPADNRNAAEDERAANGRPYNVVLHYVRFVGDTVLYATENDPELCTRGLYDHGMYPFVLDPLFPIEGSPCGYGFVDLCRNPQTAIDLMNSAIVRNAMAGAVPRFFERADGSVNEQEFLDMTKPIVHVQGNLGEDSIRQIPFSGLDGIYVSVLDRMVQELRETSGNTETSTGNISSGVTAAAAIAALQDASSKGSRDATASAYRAYGEVVTLMIELIRQFYTLPRQFRITGENGGEAFVAYSNEGLAEVPQGVLWGVDMGYRLPCFDVRVSAQKRSAYSRVSQNELALELYRLGFFREDMRSQALECLEMMDFEGKEQIRKRFAEYIQ